MAAGGLSFGWTVGVVAGIGAAAESGAEYAGSDVAEVAGSVGSAANTGNVSAFGAWGVGLWSTSLSP